LLLAKTITTITLGGDKIQRLTLNQILIALNRHENPTWHSQQGVSSFSPGNKAPNHFPFFNFNFLSSPNNEKAEHQLETNSATSWIPSSGKPP
jgi:hypothetical protein